MVVSAAHEESELVSAFRLVYRCYSAAGLALPNHLRLRIIPHQLLPSSRIFVATFDGRVVATVTIVEDGPLGLPMEATFAGPVARLRSRFTRLSEITCLACEPNHESGPAALRAMLRHCLQFGIRRRTEAAAISVHPTNVRFYRERFGFRDISGVRLCSRVCNAPAIAQWLQMDVRGRQPGLSPCEPSAVSIIPPHLLEDLRCRLAEIDPHSAATLRRAAA